MQKQRLLIFDMDGTSIDDSGNLNKYTAEAMRIMEREKIPFMIATGRSPGGVRPFQQKHDFNCAMVLHNGSLTILGDEIIHSEGISKAEAKKILTFIDSLGFETSVNIHSYDDWIVRDKGSKLNLREEKLTLEISRQGTIDTLEHDIIHKIFCIFEDFDATIEFQKLLRAEFPDYYIVESAQDRVELMKKGINKLVGIKAALRHLGFKLEDTVVFGDNYNDLEMIEAAGISFAMGNAVQALKDKADYVIGDNNGTAILETLRKFAFIP